MATSLGDPVDGARIPDASRPAFSRAPGLHAPPESPLLVRVLGPIDVQVAGTTTPLGSRFGRMLLATLALSANHMISADELAQVLWGDNPPPSLGNTLRTYLSRLRHLIGAGRIIAEDHCYQLTVTTDELDALIFETRIAHAIGRRDDPHRCLALTRSALDLWRGTAFGEFADRDPFRLEAIRLHEMRLAAMELRFECELAVGHEAIVAGALEAMVEEYPYRERMWYLLIAALSLSGRRVEALRACRRLREILAEVGLEPTTGIRELEEEIHSEGPQVRPRLRSLLLGDESRPAGDVPGGKA
jgi:DNA-binding SARP family transcriptional activator